MFSLLSNMLQIICASLLYLYKLCGKSLFIRYNAFVYMIGSVIFKVLIRPKK